MGKTLAAGFFVLLIFVVIAYFFIGAGPRQADRLQTATANDVKPLGSVSKKYAKVI